MKRKYDGKIFRLFSAIFELWPIVATIGGRIVVMHGGVPRNPTYEEVHGLEGDS